MYDRVKRMGKNANNRPITAKDQHNWQGVNYVDEPNVMQKYQVPFAQNVDFGSPIGDATKRGGLEKLFTSLGAGAVKGLHTFKHSTGDIMLMAHGTALYHLADDETPALTKTSKADWDAGTNTDTDTATSSGDVLLAVSGANFSEADTLDADFDGTHNSTEVDSNSVKLTTSIDSNTVLLLHCNGTDGSTTFTDEIGKTVTANGAVQIDTSQKKFGTGSAQFNNSSDDYLSIADSDDWNFGAGDFTIDFWVRFNATSIGGGYTVPLFDQYANSGSYWEFGVYDGITDKKLRFNSSSGSFSSSEAVAFTANVWAHIALVRSGNNFMFFKDGTQLGTSVTKNITLPNVSAPLRIGRERSSAFVSLNARIDEIRISKGVARWTANFTPQAAAYSLTTYNLTGTYEHGEQDVSTIGTTTGLTIAYNKTTPAGTSVTVQTATSTDGGSTYGDWTTRASGATIAASGTDVSNYRIKWRAILAADGNGLTTPSLDDVTVAGNTGYYTTGQWLSPVYDLTATPITATLTWTVTTPAGTSITWYARSSSNNATWGDWRAIATSGDGIPLGRYIQVKAIMAGTVTATPTISQIVIDYSTGFTTATAIDISPLGRVDDLLTGNKVRFADYLDNCYCADGLRPFVAYLDGSTVKVRNAGVDAPTAPSLAVGAATGLTGTFYGKVTYVNSDGAESNASDASSSVTVSNEKITWTIPTGTADITAQRKLYRTKAGGTAYYYVATIDDNTTTSYTDTTADSALTVLMADDNNIPPTDATIVYEYRNYMLYANDDGELWHSKVGFPDQVPNSATDIAMKSFNGPILGISEINNALTVHGEDYVSILTSGDSFILDTDPAVDTTVIRTIDKGGALSHEAIALCTDPDLRHIMVFPTRTGVRFLLPGIQEQSLESVPLSRNIQPYYDKAISRGNMAGCFFNNRYLLAFTYFDPSYAIPSANNVIFVYDFRCKQWTGPWTVRASCFAESNGELYCGSATNGAVYKMFSGNADDGSAINMILDLPPFPPAGEQGTCRFTRFLVVFSADSVTTSTTVTPKVDEAESAVSIGTITSTFTGTTRPGHNNMRSQKYPIPLNIGHTCSHRIADNSTNAVSVQKVITEYEATHIRL